MTTPKGIHVDDHSGEGRSLAAVAQAARDREPISGWTHNFYRYPARFSPRFAAAAIDSFSKPGDVIVDPYMGGGTAVVEGVVAGRYVVGNDLNALATFIAKVKVTNLRKNDVAAVRSWTSHRVPHFTFRKSQAEIAPYVDAKKVKNLSLARARFIKKAIGAALASINDLPSNEAQDFVRCAVLRVAQWALDGRKRHTPLVDFRNRLASTTIEMLEAMNALSVRVATSHGRATILNGDASALDQASPFRDGQQLATLVVTSPPYPGVHVLYHRWQVDGRRETPAPYWIAGCNDGQGASFYNFGDRRQRAAETYFRTSLATLQAIRRVMRSGGHMVQMVAFNQPEEQLPRYLRNMEEAGFGEVSAVNERIWRDVPNRKWHACLNGKTHSSEEVVLVHRAI